MLPRNQSLLCACLVFAAALGWILHHLPAGGPEGATPVPREAPGTAKFARPLPTPAPGAAVDENGISRSRGRMDSASIVGGEGFRVAHKEENPAVSARLPDDFLKRILSADESAVAIPLPGGETASGRVSLIRRDENGLLLVQGTITRPEDGRFVFQRQTIRGKAGSLAGFIYFDRSKAAWQVRPTGENGGPVLVKTTVDSVICRSYAAPPPLEGVEEIPATHPTDDPIPPDENGVIQLQSLPGASAVIYLDFDGEERNFDGWGYINAQPSGASNAQIFDVWQGVCEDFQPFQINVTTSRAAYHAAPPGQRIQVVITPTDTASPGAGGVAIIGSFNWTGELVCWSFARTGKNAVEVISHELGHTLGLSHDGRTSPYEEYYQGHNGWAPIMGIGYYRSLTQWSKGEYLNPSNLQDDLQIITTANNGVAYRADDHGASFAASSRLDIAADGTVSNEGVIATNTDRDSFRFSTTGGTVALQINPVPPFYQSPESAVEIANLDIKAEILNLTGALITTIAVSDPSNSTAASFAALNLTAGDYFLRVSGTGRGNLVNGYSNYASLGSYTVSGTVNGGVHADHFTLAENSATGTAVGAVNPRASHGGGVPSFAITSGNGSGAFAIDSATGAITVADTSQLDFESLSTRWDDPAGYELFVTVTDNLGALTESIRVVLTLTDLNEAPVFPAPPAETIPSNLPTGMEITTVSAADADRGDYIAYSIVSGNDGGHFAIDPVTGLITLAAPLDFQTTPVHHLTLRAADHRSPANQVDVPLAIQLLEVPAGFTPGSVVRTFFSGISGPAVANLTGSANFPDKPNSEVILDSFDSGVAGGDNYGSTVRGYLIAPVTGQYTFWICADESGELLLSPDADPANAVARASISTPADPGDWTKEPGQQSAVIELAAGQIHYIEARHKEASGGDHVQVAWQGPGMPAREIIPGRWLAPYHQQYAPWTPERTFNVREAASEGTLVGRVSFIEPNIGEEVASYAITSGNESGFFAIDPANGEIRVAAGAALVAGTGHALTVSATDDGSPAATGAATVNIAVIRLDQGLHAWWRLDETSGTFVRDSSGNERHAYLSGGGSWVTRGAANQALQLNGADAGFEHTDFESLYGAAPFTVAAWVKVPVTHASDGVLIEQSDASGYGEPGRYSVVVKADGRVHFSVYGRDAGSGNQDYQFEITSPETIHDGSWHHVACVRDGASGRIFIDGAGGAAGSGSIRLLEFESTTSVGYAASSGGAFLDAAVDDVRIYAEALTGSQIAKAASAPKVAMTSPAGTSAVIPAGVGLLLEAAASDPDGPAPALAWSQAGGPGSVTFGTPAAAVTTAVFPAPGSYVLRATANDGVNQADDELTVLVGSTASSAFGASGYGMDTNGGHNVLGDAAYGLYGTSAGIQENGTADGFYLLGQSFTGDFDLRARVTDAMDDWSGDPAGTAGLIVRAGTAGDSGEASGFIGFDALAASGTWFRRHVYGGGNLRTDYGMMSLPKWCRITRTGDTVEFRHSDDGSSWISRGTMTFTGEVRAGLCWSSNSTLVGGTAFFDGVSGFATSNIGPAVSAGADFAAATGLPAYLTGSAADDGLPDPPAAVTVSWSAVGGPGGVDFENPALAATTATFSKAGVHVLRLVADDGAVRTFDEVAITVTDPPPVLSVAATDANAAETGPDGGAFTLTRSAWQVGALTVNFTLTGTAANGLDYGEITGSIAMADGEQTAIISVMPLADGFVEGPETVILTLDPGAYGIAGEPAIVTIADSNHAPEFTINPITGDDAIQDGYHTGTLLGSASDPDAGDTLTFAKTSGPAWLTVAGDGTFSGTPLQTDLGPNSFTVRVTDAAGAFAEATLEINVNTPLTPYEVWLIAEFVPRTNDPLIVGELADPDMDGLPNLIEYALGTAPTEAGVSGIVQDVVEIEGASYLRLTIPRNPDATDATLTVQTTSDLTDPGSWTDMDTLIEVDTPTLLVARDTLGGPLRFMRLRVTR